MSALNHIPPPFDYARIFGLLNSFVSEYVIHSWSAIPHRRGPQNNFDDHYGEPAQAIIMESQVILRRSPHATPHLEASHI